MAKAEPDSNAVTAAGIRVSITMYRHDSFCTSPPNIADRTSSKGMDTEPNTIHPVKVNTHISITIVKTTAVLKPFIYSRL